MRFYPVSSSSLDPAAMRIDKLGSLISPLGVVLNGSKTLHAVSRGVTYGKSHSDEQAFSVDSTDVPVVKIGAGAASLAADALLDGLNPAPVPNDREPDVEG